MDLDPDIFGQIILIIALTMVNAFFASAEMAIVSINKVKIHGLAQANNKKAKLVEKLLSEPTNFLSTIQVGITLAGFFSSASAATGISKVVGASLLSLGVPFGEQIAFIAITILLSYITLVFGELVPKRIALQKAESIAMFSARPIIIVGTIVSPFIKILSFSTSLVLRMVGMHSENIEEQVSEEEIRSMMAVGQEHGVFNETEKDMIDSIFKFDDILADQIMTPRTDAYCIDIHDEIKDYLDELMEMKYSRIPVYEDDVDNIIGILNIKDFVIEARIVGFEHVDIRKILRKPYFVPESKNIDELFKEMQKSRQHISILIDEYGGFSGLVSIEDLIEEVMGDIEDEFDDGEPKLIKIDQSTYMIDGLYSIDDINEELHLHIPSDNHDTISGFIIDLIGYIPDDGEENIIEFENLIFKVNGMDEKRIDKVKLCIQPSPEVEEA